MEIILSFWNVLAMMAVVYALVIALGAVLCGVGINLLPFDILPQVTADAAYETLAWWEHLAAAVLVALVGYGLISSIRQHQR